MKQIIIKNLKKVYGTNTIFENLNLKLTSDKIYFLTDENGTGKTTFFYCLLKEINYEGSVSDMGYIYAFMPEKPNLPEHLCMMTFLKLFYYYDHDGDDLEDLYKLVDEFDIKKYSNQRIHTLSKGTKQKIALIKTLLMEADIYLFDEPLAGLDKRSRDIFIECLQRLALNDKIIIIATHYYNDYLIYNKEQLSLK